MCSHNEGGSILLVTFLHFSSRPFLDIVIAEYFPLRDQFLSVGLSARVPVLAEGVGGNDGIEGFSCHYVG